MAGQSATDVSGPVPLWADLGQEAGRLGEAVDLVTGPMGGAVTVLYDVRDLSPASVEVLEKMAGEREGWQVRSVMDYTGAEEEKVVVVGSGQPEGISRARGMMGLVTVWETEEGKRGYELMRPGYVQAEKLGLVQLVLNTGQ